MRVTQTQAKSIESKVVVLVIMTQLFVSGFILSGFATLWAQRQKGLPGVTRALGIRTASPWLIISKAWRSNPVVICALLGTAKRPGQKVAEGLIEVQHKGKLR